MPQKAEYKLVTGTSTEMSKEVVIHSNKNWKPILMTSTLAGDGIRVTVIFERVVEQ